METVKINKGIQSVLYILYNYALCSSFESVLGIMTPSKCYLIVVCMPKSENTRMPKYVP